MSAEDAKAITERLDKIERLTMIGAKNTLDFDDAVLYTGFSKGHLYRLTANKQIPHFKLCRKLYFSKTKLDEWMQKNPVLTKAEIDSKASTYVAIHR